MARSSPVLTAGSLQSRSSSASRTATPREHERGSWLLTRASNGERQDIEGSCHCKKVRFRASLAIEDGTSDCNCSICSRVGWIMKSIPPSQFELVAGETEQTDYQFGGKSMHHRFCSTYGIHAFGSFTHEVATKIVVNVRCLDGVDLAKLEVETFNRKSS